MYRISFSKPLPWPCLSWCCKKPDSKRRQRCKKSILQLFYFPDLKPSSNRCFNLKHLYLIRVQMLDEGLKRGVSSFTTDLCPWMNLEQLSAYKSWNFSWHRISCPVLILDLYTISIQKQAFEDPLPAILYWLWPVQQWLETLHWRKKVTGRPRRPNWYCIQGTWSGDCITGSPFCLNRNNISCRKAYNRLKN